jgi:hypothetical protein
MYNQQARMVRIPLPPPFSLPNWFLRSMERKKARIFAETRVVLRGTGLRRIELLVIKLNQLEFSAGSGPAVRFHLPSGERRGVCDREAPPSLPVTLTARQAQFQSHLNRDSQQFPLRFLETTAFDHTFVRPGAHKESFPRWRFEPVLPP